MVQLTLRATSGDFITQYSDNEHYRLIDRELIRWNKLDRTLQQVAAFVGRNWMLIDRRDATYYLIDVSSILRQGTAFRPDVIVLDQNHCEWTIVAAEPVITLGSSVKLVVEVVSTNWQNDYAGRWEDYAVECTWVVDRGLLALAGENILWNLTTITICALVEI